MNTLMNKQINNVRCNARNSIQWLDQWTNERKYKKDKNGSM
jgi:hypothetical protein